MIMHYVSIGLGGALGAISRVFIGKFLPPSAFGMPFQILSINIIGCLMMGVLTEVLALHWSASNNLRSFLAPGFLSGFTTFSAFALEFGLLQGKGLHFLAILYIFLTILLGLGAFIGGLKIIRLFS